MYFGTGSILLLLLIVALGVLLWRQSGRLNAVEFELANLRDLLMKLRSQIEEGAPARRTIAPAPKPESAAAGSQEAAPAATIVAKTVSEPLPSLEPKDEAPIELGPWSPPPVADAPAPDAMPAGKPDIETALGTRWAVWVGGLALALGGAFLVRYTIEAGLLGPTARLMLGALFGAALIAGGEFIRRTGFVVKAAGDNAAYLPGILTAAGAFTLFAVVYAAHGVYGFIGPGAAFALLALIGIATMAAALVHGQALAGVGLVGAYAAPLLVSSHAPNAWALFIEVAVALGAAAFIARHRRWLPLMLAAEIGAGLWLLVYLADGAANGVWPSAFIGLVMIAALIVLWLRDRKAVGEARFAGVADPVGLAVAVPVGLAALMLGTDGDLVALGGALVAAALVLALAGAAAWRADATAGLVAATVVAVGFAIRAVVGDESSLLLLLRGSEVQFRFVQTLTRPQFLGFAVPVGLAMLAGGIWFAGRHASAAPLRGGLWAAAAALAPVALVTASWLGYGNPEIDFLHALLLAALAGGLFYAGETIGRDEKAFAGWPMSVLWIGAALALLAALHAGSGPATTTMLVALAAATIAYGWLKRPAAVLTWIAAAMAVVLLGRMAFDPTLIGAASLGTLPVFNYLLPGYLLPAAAFSAAAWALRGTPRGSPELLGQGMAAVLALVGAGMLVRHAINGGVLDGSEPQLAETAIDSLIAIGGGAVLVALDRRAASPVFREGSMVLGVISLALVLFGHLLALNPLVTNASTGTIPFVNLLLLAYLLPGLALGGLALFARPYRPLFWVRALTAAGALLVFVYATLSARRWFKGEFIGYWKGLEPLETWTYSALWLTLGVVTLFLGVRLNSLVLRFGSAILVVLAVAKVFLFDMSELEGALRAFSFIALGLVLIGIGLFYQRLLTKKAG
ncbi:MAG: DUF2339 domain-containing protein [Phyllobacteriaceae bacterium]|nr:DUF2339 domain-containing protein [Phyllobacteriaceae bacterium]